MKFFSVVKLCLFSLLISSSAISHAQQSIFDVSPSLFNNESEYLKVDQAFIFNFHQKENQLSVSFDIADGYYLYKKQFIFDATNASHEEVVLPTGKTHEDEFFGVQEIYTGSVSTTLNFSEIADNATLTVRYQGCAEKGLCYPPEIRTVQLSAYKALLPTTDNAAVLSAISAQPSTDVSQSNTAFSSQNESTTVGTNTENTSEQFQLAAMLAEGDLLFTLIAFFVGGLLLSFTPCVFPMYPILTGIIVGQGKQLSNKKAFSLSFIYVQGMALTYTALGIVVALAGAQFQAMFQHPLILILLSILFVFLALAMFGLFNLALPASWQNTLNNLSQKQKGGSFLGVLSMGAISGLVASPCTTAPLTGALLYISQSGDVALGAAALYALSIGMGLPLLVLGSSGGKLLPKAGAWMNVIKNIFGLLLLAVPIFLLERFLPAAISQILWVMLLLASGAYLYTFNQQTKPSFWFGMRSLVIFALLFVGLNKGYQLMWPSTSATIVAQTNAHPTFKQISSLSELNAEIAQASKAGKSVMVDLYADWCIACKEFEEYTFPDPKVQQALHNTVLLQIDLTDTGTKESVEFMGHFEIFGLPSILLFNSQGNELAQQRVTGFMGAEDFAKHVASAFANE
ncbi:protein-disulfide reductase DsbD [Thalassotalea fusca]